jgi:tRNA (cytidine56-2'-O)-methyltransferase
MISVLRIGHRPERDKRITTHVALVARAFGADHLLVDTKDSELEKNLASVCKRFGGQITIKTGVKWREELKKFKGQKVHLTMYGDELEYSVGKLDRSKNLMIVVGAEKVPREAYELSDYNISVGNQPHSEVAALAVFLYRYFDCRPFREFEDGQMKILPNKRGKTVVGK